MRRVALPALAALAVALVLVPSSGATGEARPKPLLWATVNVCDTPASPNVVGIRASMPGTGRKRDRMFMRFRIEFFRASDNRWHDLGAEGDSGFLAVGSARYRARQAGRNFQLGTPPAGSFYRLRGRVTFEWRRGSTVLRRASRLTQAGHPGTTGSDPKGFSAAECRIEP